MEVGIRHKGERRGVKVYFASGHELDMFSKKKKTSLPQKTMLSPWVKVFDISLDNESHVSTLGGDLGGEYISIFSCLHF